MIYGHYILPEVSGLDGQVAGEAEVADGGAGGSVLDPPLAVTIDGRIGASVSVIIGGDGNIGRQAPVHLEPADA